MKTVENYFNNISLEDKQVNYMEIIELEIPVLDLDKGIMFYENVFGWEIDRNVIPGQGYVKLNEGVSVGIFQTEKMRPKGLNVGLAVEDITTTLKKIVEVKKNFKNQSVVVYSFF